MQDLTFKECQCKSNVILSKITKPIEDALDKKYKKAKKTLVQKKTYRSISIVLDVEYLLLKIHAS